MTTFVKVCIRECKVDANFWERISRPFYLRKPQFLNTPKQKFTNKFRYGASKIGRGSEATEPTKIDNRDELRKCI